MNNGLRDAMLPVRTGFSMPPQAKAGSATIKEFHHQRAFLQERINTE
ncbi:MAG: hypothetical protein LBP90_06160 [Burkholderiales bacterium]|nr:hypothetical protein [Burkholderiales bacterium]